MKSGDMTLFHMPVSVRELSFQTSMPLSETAGLLSLDMWDATCLLSC